MRIKDRRLTFAWLGGLGLLAALVAASAANAKSSAPLRDPVVLNIGLSCQWQQRCIGQQTKAMKRALKFVRKKQPPTWRVEMCNRNASRKRARVDWVGFDNCIRNADLRPAPVRASSSRKRSKSRVRSAPAPASNQVAYSRGERGS